MYKKIKASIVIGIMLVSGLLAITTMVSADGPNYMYFATPPFSIYRPSGDYYEADNIFNESFVNQSDGALLYESVNDENDTTYLEWDALEKMTFDITGQALSGTISSVTLHARLKRSGGLATQCGYEWLLNDTATEWASSEYKDTTTSFTEKTYVLATNPFTSVAWTWTDFTMLKAGIYQSSITSGRLLSVSEYWLTVETTSAPGIDVTIGDDVRMDILVNLTKQADTICVKNISYLPAGIVNYLADSDGEKTTGYTQKGILFSNPILYQEPTPTSTHNSQGWVGGSGEAGLEHFLNAQKNAQNNTVASGWLITWSAVGCGNATLTIQPYSSSWGGTAYNGTDLGTTYRTGYIRVHPQATTAFTATAIHYNEIGLSWTKHTGDDKVLIRYSDVSAPTSVTSGTFLYNGSDSSYSDTTVTGGVHRYYSAWGWNTTAGYYSLTYQTADDQTNRVPVLSSVTPPDNSGNIDKSYPQVSVAINDPDGNTFNWSIHSIYLTNASANGATNGTKTASLKTPLAYGTNVIWYVNVTDGTDWTNATYNFTVRSEYAPVPPTGLTATTINRFRIDVNWTKTNDRTIVEWNTVPGPWARGAGNPLCNSTGITFQHTSRTEGTTYYYQAWSYNTTDNVYSALNVSDSNTTIDDLQPVLTNPDPANGAPNIDKNKATVGVTINDPEGDPIDWTIHGTYVNTDSGNDDTNGTKTATLITPLAYGTIITWYVNATDGYEWTNATYTFTVRSEYEPTAPTGFTATVISRFQINLNWTLGTGNDKVVIIAKLGSPPTLGVDSEIFNGTGLTYNDVGLLPGEHWYYIAYGWNTTDNVYSDLFASADETTTGNNEPNSFTSETPTNNAAYVSVYGRYLNVTVSDPESDSMTVSFYWGNDTLIHAVGPIASGAQASIYLPDYISPDWLKHQNQKANYTWYAVANDGYNSGQSSTWLYKTSYAWDVNEDGDIGYLDVSGLVSPYGSSCTAGSIGADINEDGAVGYLDVSGFVSHYGTHYYP